MKKLRNRKGTTLVEILMYFALLSVVMGAVMSFAFLIVDMSTKSQSLRETQANLEFITRNLVASVQTARDIDETNSVFGVDDGRLALVVNDAGRSPTQYYVENENLYVKYGSSDPVQLNSDAITCTSLNFTKISQLKMPDQVGIDAVFEAGYADMAGLDSLLNIHTSVSLRL
jgi:hypothetical protein